MSGRVPPSSRAGRGRIVGTAAQQAARRYERFTGETAQNLGKVSIPSLPKAVSCMGVCAFIGYDTFRDGKPEKFIHKFKPADAPMVCVTPDGRQILLIGGRYRWTDRGIVDNTDKS